MSSDSREFTRKDRKTRYGKVPDYVRAKNELDEREIGELVNHIADYEKMNYFSAQEVARAFHEEDPSKYNENQMLIREVAKEKVTKESQPEWAWDLLSVYSEDIGKKLLEVPSEGQHKGLLIEEPESGDRKCYLYSKDANGISSTKHIERHHLNIRNAESIGYKFPSDTVERVSLDIDEEVAMMRMDFNETMVPTDRLEGYLEGRVQYPGDWHNKLIEYAEEEMLNSSYSPDWFERSDPYIPSGGRELFDLGDLVEYGLFFSKGSDEFESTTGNLAFNFPENWEDESEFEKPRDLFEASEVIVVDSGEYFETISGLNRESRQRMIEEDPILTEEEKNSMLNGELSHRFG